MSRVLVPAINILQARTNSSADSGGRDGAVLEGVRGRWCTLLDIQMPADKHDYLISIFNTVVPDDNSGIKIIIQTTGVYNFVNFQLLISISNVCTY